MRRGCVLIIVLLLLVSTALATDIDPLVEEALENSDEVRVIIVLDDQPTDKEEIKEEQEEILDKLTLKGEEIVTLGVKEEADFDVKHKYETINAISGNVTKKGLNKLKRQKVKAVYLDRKVSIALDKSIPQINADDFWLQQINGANLTGTGETVCVVDTGIDYTHTALGGCNPVTYTASGTTETITQINSSHPYPNSADITYTITQPGYTKIAAHFINISLEAPGDACASCDATDRIIVYDKNNVTLAVYKGDHTDVWTPYGEGDTLYIKLVSDSSVTDDGFYIDKVVNGTTNKTMNWSACPTIIGGWDFVNTDNDPNDDNGHGTHVAGTIASNDSTHRGVSPDAKLIAQKVLDSNGDGWFSDVNAAIDWCTSNKGKYNISVISMSIGTGTTFSSTCDASLPSTAASINAAVAKNIAVIVASGNGGVSTGISAPACIANATSVGRVDGDDSVSSSSNAVSFLDLLAPGSGIKSTTSSVGDTCGAPKSNDFKSCSGTSMATPHVAGAYALLQQYFKATTGNLATPSEITTRLKNTGALINDTRNSLIFPRIDLEAAFGPIITFITPLNNTNITTSSTLINISSNINVTNAIIEWTHDNNSIFNYSMDKETDTIFSYTINNLSSGTHNYKVYANNSLTGVSKTQSLTVNLNVTEPPKITFVTPTNGLNTSTSFIINASVTSTINISSVQFNVSNLTLSATKNGEYWDALLNTSLLTEGTHTLYAIATDSESNVNSTFQTFTLDITPPELTLLTPANNSEETSNRTITFTYNVSDTTGARNCSLYLNSVLNESNSGISFTKTLADGNYNYTISCTDYIDLQINKTQTITISVDIPTITLNSPVNGKTTVANVTFDCSATDDLSLNSISLYGNWSSWHLNETTNLTGTSNQTTFSKTLPEGTHLWSCIVSDGTNQVSSTNRTITIDATSPVISSVSAGSITENSATISWTTDEDSNSTVYYGSTKTKTTYEKDHGVSLSGLSASTTYSYTVTSCDLAGNCATSTSSSFTTTTAPDSGSTGGSSGGGGGSSSSSSSSSSTPTPTKVSEPEPTPKPDPKPAKANTKKEETNEASQPLDVKATEAVPQSNSITGAAVFQNVGSFMKNNSIVLAMGFITLLIGVIIWFVHSRRQKVYEF